MNNPTDLLPNEMPEEIEAYVENVDGIDFYNHWTFEGMDIDDNNRKATKPTKYIRADLINRCDLFRTTTPDRAKALEAHNYQEIGLGGSNFLEPITRQRIDWWWLENRISRQRDEIARLHAALIVSEGASKPQGEDEAHYETLYRSLRQNYDNLNTFSKDQSQQLSDARGEIAKLKIAARRIALSAAKPDALSPIQKRDVEAAIYYFENPMVKFDRLSAIHYEVLKKAAIINSGVE